MADDELERNDPVLVRPYITTEPGGGTAGHDDRPAETWPEQAALPDSGTREMAPVEEPAPAPERVTKSSVLLRQRLLVLSGVAVLAVLVGAGLVVFGLSDEDPPPPAAQPTAAAPGVTGSLGAAPVASATATATTATTAAARSAAPPSRPAAANRATTTEASVPAAANEQPAAPPSPTLAPPPAAARTGSITAASGRCLNLGALLALDGSPVQTAGCADVSYQEFTLATDGTLRVANKCAEVTGDGTVRIAGCDDRQSAQWRAGPGGSLVNPGTQRCLTDPGRSGTPTTATACTGAADQTWTLP